MKNFHVKFYENRKIYFTISLAIILAGVIFNVIFGTALDIQFKGGAMINYTYSGEIDQSVVESKVEEVTGQNVDVRIYENMNQDAANDEEMTVTLTLDDGTDLECVVLTIFEAADKEYIALLPLDGNEAEDGEVYLYRYSEDAEGNPDIQNIESDEEYEIVADAFDEFLDTAEYDEIVSEEDLDD